MGKLLSHDSTHAPPPFSFFVMSPVQGQASLLVVEKRPPFRFSREREKICSRSAPMCLPPQRSSRTYDLAKRRHTTVYSNGCTARLKYLLSPQKTQSARSARREKFNSGQGIEPRQPSEIAPPLFRRRETGNTSSPLAVQGP